MGGWRDRSGDPALLDRSAAEGQDQSHKTVKSAIWMLYDTSALTSGFSLEEPTAFTDRIHRSIQLGLSEDDDEAAAEEEDLPALKSTEEGSSGLGRTDDPTKE